jgi:hypothetical protein
MGDLMVIALRAPSAIAAAIIYTALMSSLQASPTCPDEQPTAQYPQDLKLCRDLEPIVRNPGGLPLNEYEAKLGAYLGAFCHRDTENGWRVDKRIRDTGPWAATYRDGKWRGQYYGTHAPVMVWYSPDFYAWLKTNRPGQGPVPASATPVPDGAMIIKEMYPAPAAACASVEPINLLPNKHGSAVMVRDSKVAHDGWFWGWFGWPGSGWGPDWPAPNTSPMQNMGFGQYCTNCHASAVDNQTFAALKNIKGEAGQPTVFLSQDFFQDPTWQSHHLKVLRSAKLGFPPPKPAASGDSAFSKLLALSSPRIPLTRDQLVEMPPTTYDNVWVKPGGPTVASQFVTSDQCLGCHDAGSTGLQFDMTQPGTDTQVVNNSPYATWRGSPMGLAGRDPIFFAQLASETETFHREVSPFVQDTCLGCHGIMGQRQFAIDNHAKTQKCEPFPRSTVDAIPYMANDPVSRLAAAYGALARDGISCTACHHMVLGETESAIVQGQPQNKCVDERQAVLNPGLTKFAKTFTGSFLVGPPDRLYGPFEEPKIKPMKNAIGIEPAHNNNIKSSELCGTCHTVHLPVLVGDKTIAHSYEQTTYPEWAFSDYRTGKTADGPLPNGPGPLAQSCQDCHMPTKDAAGNPNRSKIASIQEYTNFPQTENTLLKQDIDLPVREGFGKHTLVGLNVFLLEMAAQFPKLLGIRPTDPMLGADGIDSIPNAKAAMMDQAMNRTAEVRISNVSTEAGTLNARVTVTNRVGHKFPSGVGFRRAFLEFSVLDRDTKVLWSSGRTDSSGILVDENGAALPGEKWWKDDCSSRIEPQARIHQPHYQEITSQNQVQIFQELVSTPPDAGAKCGRGVAPQGQLTTSFLSICTTVKDNRLLPHGFLDLDQRKQISKALGAGDDMAEDSGAVGTGDDPDYRSGGSDSLTYRVPLAALKGNAKPASVLATLYYQATPPFFLQDRFCTSNSTDTQRLSYLAGNLSLAATPAQDWKLRVVSSGPVAVP